MIGKQARKNLVSLVLGVILVGASNVYAENYEEIVVVNGIDAASMTIVLDKKRYRLSRDVKVYSKDAVDYQRELSRLSGKRIGFEAGYDQSADTVSITKIWVLRK